MNARLQALSVKILSGGAASTFFGIFQGRCTFFAIIYSVIGIYGWLHLNRDLTSFALFMTASQGLLVLHSWKEDVAEQKTVEKERADRQ